MTEIEHKIYVSEEILKNEYSYVYGEKSSDKVLFSFYNFKKDKLGDAREFPTYKYALELARYKAGDKRYRNYEFFITHI